MNTMYEVAIVGGGPVGLTAALCLSRAGVRVLLIEAESETAKEQRGAAFHPPTLEMLGSLGVTEKVLPIGVKVPIWQIRDRSGLIAQFDLGLLSAETAYPFRFHLPQHLLSEALIKELQTTSARLLFGSKVSSVTQRADYVDIVYTDGDEDAHSVQAAWVIGADGAHSAVRKACAIDFQGFSWPERFLVTNIVYPLEGLGFSGTAYVSDPENWAVVIKLADGVHKDLWRVAMPADPDLPVEEVLAPEAVQRRLMDVLPGGTNYPVVYSNTYRVHQRVAERFRERRCLLAGDAAHINNPLGGFGLNGGIHDAFNLAEALVQTLRDPAGSDAPLDRYARQRRYVAVEHVQAQSIRNKRQIEEKDPEQRLNQASELRAIASDRSRAHSYLMDTSMLTSIRRAAQIA